MERSSARRRPGRPPREIGGIQQRPWKQLTRPYPPIEMLSADHVQAIHEAALTILEEIGMRVLQPQARRLYREAGADVDEGEMRVRFDRALRDGAHRHRAVVASSCAPAIPRRTSRSAGRTASCRRSADRPM